MDKARKTEIVDNAIFETLKKLHDEYDGKINFTSDSKYSSGHITIKIKD